MSERVPPQYGRDLTIGSVARQMLAFALPMLAGSVLMLAYSFVNAIWVGQFLGKTALAAVTVSFPIFMALISLGGGLTLAANILVAQHYGAGRRTEMRRVVDSSSAVILVLSLVVFVVGELFAEAILRVMDTPPDVLAAAAVYMRIFLLSQPFVFAIFLLRNLLQGIGDSTTPLRFMAWSVGLNIVLDPLLMLGWLGFPRLGLAGAAWSSVISNVVAVVILLVHLHRQRNPVLPQWRLTVHGPTVGSLMRIGLPSAVQQSLVSVSMFFVITLVNRFGENATAAYGAATRLEQLVLMPAMVFGMAIATMAGQNLGAGKPERVKAIFLRGIVLSGGGTLLVSAAALILPQALLRIFIADPDVIRLGTTYLRMVAPFYVCFAIMFVSNGIINGAGHTLVTTGITALSLLVVRVPVAYLMVHLRHDVSGVWTGIAAGFAVSMTAGLLYYASGRWRRAVTAPAPAAPLVEV